MESVRVPEEDSREGIRTNLEAYFDDWLKCDIDEWNNKDSELEKRLLITLLEIRFGTGGEKLLTEITAYIKVHIAPKYTDAFKKLSERE